MAARKTKKLYTDDALPTDMNDIITINNHEGNNNNKGCNEPHA